MVADAEWCTPAHTRILNLWKEREDRMRDTVIEEPAKFPIVQALLAEARCAVDLTG
jgi:hypothetical protein